MFSLIFLLSSWAKEERTVSISSPSPVIVEIFSFSKTTSTPNSLSSRTSSNTIVVFLAKREMDFVKIRSSLPSLANANIF